MAKLTKAESKLHHAAVALLSKESLSEQDIEFFYTNWRADAEHDVGRAGAFFTPLGLAYDMAMMGANHREGRIIDLCAGIGVLTYAHINRYYKPNLKFVCIEKNPAYVAIGKKLLPDVEWICGDVFDVLSMGLGHFDAAISNPPFGKVERNGKTAPRYTGAKFELHVMDIAAHLSDYGCFISPQNSFPFRYSGRPYHSHETDRAYDNFHKQTGITLSCDSIDTTMHRDDWHGVSPLVEVGSCDFECKEFYHTKPLGRIQTDKTERPRLIPSAPASTEQFALFT